MWNAKGDHVDKIPVQDSTKSSTQILNRIHKNSAKYIQNLQNASKIILDDFVFPKFGQMLKLDTFVYWTVVGTGPTL